MPRKKSHGYPPSKRIKNNTEKVLSIPIKAKPLENCERSSNEVLIGSSLLKSESAQENLPVHGKYLHKKFKKMATTALSPDETLNGNRVKSVLFPVPNKNNEDEVSSQKITPTELVLPITSNKNEMTENNHIINTASSMNVIIPIGSNALGRHICSYCKLVCAKPSVLQKHIRAHTNERPYPCQPCGFAFKTKSNLYKHCRSRAHALKVEEVGDEMSSKFNLPLEESTSEDEDIPTKVSEINSNEEITNNNKEEPPAKSIYKPKFHTASIYLQSSVNVEKEDTSDTELQSQGVRLKIPTSLSSQSILSTPSAFTSGSSPSPEFLHRHISKLISENQAIVETMDPFWPKKFLHRTNSKDNSSPSSLSSSPSPGAENLIPKRNIQRLSNSTIDNLSNTQENVSDSEKNVGLRHTTHSKLALALLRPQSSTSPLFSSSSVPSESIDAPLNLTTNSSKIETSNTNNRKRSYSEGLPSPKCLTNKISNIQLKLYNMKQESRKPINSLNDTSVSLFANNIDEKKCSQLGNPQNPEGSIIKDLLLKARAASTGPMFIGNYATSMPEILSNIKASNIIVHEKDERSFSPNQFVCDVCKITFRNVQSFDFHQLYYCKGLREESSSLNSPPPHFGSVSDLPSNKILLNNKDRKDFGKRDPILIAPSYPSPGPLLGNTPLVDSYYTNNQEFEGSSKKRKVENENLLTPQNVHPVSATTLRSLEELSKYPMRSNALQMFGGEVKILDTAGGETKTIRIEPSNRGTPQTTEVQLLLSTHSPDKKNLNIDKIEGKESNPQIVVTIAKTGLHSGGGTIVQVPQKITVNDSIQQQISKQNSTSTTVNTTLTPTVEPHILPNSSYGDSNKYIIPIIPNIISQNLSLPAIPTPVQLPFIPFTSMMTDNNIINPLTSITAYNPLTLPTASFLSSIGKRPNSDMSSPYSGGLVTILHGGKEIPYVPGMPGPHSLLSTNSNLSFSGKTSEEKN
uniref:C2H2-type domain-containing protein n=1 Tax=Clastoptera arizonana TaxID=38151 RepID=A0A1B6D0N5_9HEMI